MRADKYIELEQKYKQLEAQNKAILENHLGALAIEYIRQKGMTEEWAFWMIDYNVRKKEIDAP